MLNASALSPAVQARGFQPGMAKPDLSFVGGIPGHAVDYELGEEVHGEGEPALYVYRVVSGVVRTFTLLSDGRRQIESFHFPGDVFGIGVGDVHHVSAEAVCDTKLLVIKRATVEALSQRDCAAARELWTWTYRALEKARSQMLLLGRKNALERVASFLLGMLSPAQNGALEIPMCRSDIADYLGLTIETVSRNLSQLERSGAISLLSSRRIEIRNRSKLMSLAV